MGAASTWVRVLARVAIVGRPNVGKSSLFNRMIGRKEAIVADQPGVTRDVKEDEVVTSEGRRFWLLDTGGLWSGDRWEKPIRERIEAMLTGVDLVLFSLEGRQGVTPADNQVADWLRGLGKPVMVVATKIDDPRHEEQAEFYELYGLGFGEPLPTSAEHDRGMDELVAEVLRRLPEDDGEADEEAVRVAIIGRPNVGKSSILNALIGDERVIVSEEPGTTRDSVDVRFAFAGRPFVLVDTAGIRRKSDVDLEFYMRLRSEAAMRRSDVAVLVVDPGEFGDHEMRVANLALAWGKPVVVAINKWDLVTDEQLAPIRADLDRDLSHLDFAPRVYTSAVTDFGLHELLATAVRLYDTSRRRVATGEMNAWVEVWTQNVSPPNFQGRPLKLYYTSQVDVAPPTFVFSVNNERFVTRPYEQYLRNRIREDLGFAEVPFRMVFKSRRKEGGKRVRSS